MTARSLRPRVDVDRIMRTKLPDFEYTVERGAVRQFALAIGETDPVCLDVESARAAGHPDLLAPPTFLFGVDRDRPFPLGYLRELGVDGGRLLHGEQSFANHRAVHAGDVLMVRRRVTDAYPKGSRLTFVTSRTEVSNVADDVPVATLDMLVIVREGAS